MNIEILTREQSKVSYAQLVELMHESFQERIDAGLNYSCSSMDEIKYKEKTKDGIIFVAIDKDKGTLAGSTTLNLHCDNNEVYGYMEFVSIHSTYKHCGIGSKLVNQIKRCGVEKGCRYILSDTSINALSAVNFHLKNGFKIIGLESYRSTNYWSYVFRMQLSPSIIWNNQMFLKVHYWLSYLFIKVTRDINGNDTKYGIIYKKLIRLCRN